MKKYSVLFVCTGNICRSPTADGVMREKVIGQGLAAWVVVDSAGTHDFHVGEPPDIRSQKHALKRGYDMASLRARLVQPDDFEKFDWILAMDSGHMEILKYLCPTQYRDKLHFFTEFYSRKGSRDVPDPYYGDANGFEHVLDLVEDGCDGLLRQLKTLS